MSTDPATATGCCPAWDRLAGVDRSQWAWQVLHQLAHSRIPFTTDGFTHLAGCAGPEAGRLITIARHHRWIVHRDGVWLGRLGGP
jgi:hypothetical protein